ncbi:radical SAM protein [Chitinophagaceae bacterium 26-R-25]|nr:radical SAM protein [Chitinophagaceae bacterium 26-R-25]
MSKMINLPSMICFRVTRFCNARCGFCLAPPDGGVHPPVAILKERIDWLFANEVKTIHFCGGEPTIHHQLHELIEYVHLQHGKSKLTTNGIALPDRLVRALYTTKTQVKVSLHGPAAHHNEVVGCDAYDKTVTTIHRLIAAGIFTSVQTTIVSGQLSVVDWAIQFCLDNGIKRISFLPFIPRGNGLGQRSKYELSAAERRTLHDLVKQKRHKLMSRIDIRLLDFNATPIHVVEPDGRLVLEKATEAMDELLYRIPEAQVSIQI